MSMYYSYDLTGIDPEFYVTDVERMVFMNTQKIMFDIPVFDNEKLEVIMVDGLPVNLVRNTEFIILSSDINYDAMSKMKAIDASFNKTLLKSITINKTFVSEYHIQLKFNQIYPNSFDYSIIDPLQHVELTPALISNMSRRLELLSEILLYRSKGYSIATGDIRVLDIDPDGTNPANMITNEIHNVNSLDNIIFIRPTYGAFFKNSLVVKNNLTQNVLTEDIDYKVIEADIAKTSTSANASGLFSTIKMLIEFVGDVKIDYQAYGGQTDVTSIVTTNEKINSIVDFLTGNPFITAPTLRSSPVITKMKDQLQSLEGKMRLLLQNGLPSYGDISSGTSLLKKVSAIDSTDHFWNIATLYQVEGSTDYIKSDVFKFRIASLYSKMMFECSVAVDVINVNNSVMSVRCLNSNVPNNVLSAATPKLRLLRANTGGSYEGVILQIGMKLTVALQETLSIEDLSGKESCWLLVPFDPANTPPQDDDVLMPDGVTTWSSVGVDYSSKTQIIPMIEGMYIVLNKDIEAGVTPFGDPDFPTVLDNTDAYPQFFSAVDKLLIDKIIVDLIANPSVELIEAYQLVIDTKYRIIARTTLDFTTCGAADNEVGTEFVAINNFILGVDDIVEEVDDAAIRATTILSSYNSDTEVSSGYGEFFYRDVNFVFRYIISDIDETIDVVIIPKENNVTTSTFKIKNMIVKYA